MIKVLKNNAKRCKNWKIELETRTVLHKPRLNLIELYMKLIYTSVLFDI